MIIKKKHYSYNLNTTKYQIKILYNFDYYIKQTKIRYTNPLLQASYKKLISLELVYMVKFIK